MKKVFYLSTCDTCKRIINDLDLRSKDFEFQDIKFDKMTPDQVDHMVELAGTFESIFSKRSRKYKEFGLKDKTLSEQDLRQFILDEYTFLKRPVIIDGNEIFIGNSAKNIELARLHLAK